MTSLAVHQVASPVARQVVSLVARRAARRARASRRSTKCCMRSIYDIRHVVDCKKSHVHYSCIVDLDSFAFRFALLFRAMKV